VEPDRENQPFDFGTISWRFGAIKYYSCIIPPDSIIGQRSTWNAPTNEIHMDTYFVNSFNFADMTWYRLIDGPRGIVALISGIDEPRVFSTDTATALYKRWIKDNK